MVGRVPDQMITFEMRVDSQIAPHDNASLYERVKVSVELALEARNR